MPLFSHSVWAIQNITVPNMTNWKCDQLEISPISEVSELKCRKLCGAEEYWEGVFSEGELTRWREEGGEKQKFGQIHTLALWHSNMRVQFLKTLCKVMWGDHSQSVTKNLTPYRFNFFGWGLDGQITEIHSFPTMYIIGGGKWGRNGSKQWFSPKKWSKNSFFE